MGDSFLPIATLAIILALPEVSAYFDSGEDREIGTPFAAVRSGVASDIATAARLARTEAGDKSDGVFLERRRINVAGEQEAFELIDRGVSSFASPRESVRDVRWGLVGPTSPVSAFQFIVVTDGEEATRAEVSSTLRAAGARKCGFVSVSSFVVVGTPSSAAVVRRVEGVSWVGSLTPADRTARAWDIVLPALERVVHNGTLPWRYGGHEMDAATFLEAAGIDVDDAGRVTMDVAFPLVADEDTPERVLEGVSPDLADFAADEIARGVSDAASDPGAWVELVPATSPSVKKLVAHVRTRGL